MTYNKTISEPPAKAVGPASCLSRWDCFDRLPGQGGSLPRYLAVLAARTLLFVIQLYRWTVSPAQTLLFGTTAGCRWTPTCSQYAMEAIDRHGAGTGGLLALKRICRCHPFGGCGHDPVPNKLAPRKHIPLNSNG